LSAVLQKFQLTARNARMASIRLGQATVGIILTNQGEKLIRQKQIKLLGIF
jgi:hypothetical protein